MAGWNGAVIAGFTPELGAIEVSTETVIAFRQGKVYLAVRIRRAGLEDAYDNASEKAMDYKDKAEKTVNDAVNKAQDQLNQ